MSTTAAAAHPHVFIDTGIEVFMNASNEAVAVQISWTYDEFYSLSTIGDMGLDPDGDGKLTSEEEASLRGFDMQWIEGFSGDTYVLLGDTPQGLSQPRDWTVRYQDGRIISTHIRDLAQPLKVSTDPLVIQAYDPSYYTAYFIVPPAQVTGGKNCTAPVFEPELGAADAELQAALQEYSPGIDLEAEFPAVGARFADEVRVTCDAF